MADQKITELTAITTPGDTDVLPVVDNSGTPTTKKITWANIKATIKSYYDSVAATLTNKTINASSNTITNLTTSMFATNTVDTDTSLAANSDTRLATQKATKAYVDALLAASDAVVYKGVINASSNPNYPAADAGHLYRISVAGKIGGASGINVEVGDTIICLTDSTSSGNQATVGSNWNIIQVNIDGAVVGPSSVTDSNPTVFDGTTGKLIKQITYSAFKTALSLVKGDVGLGNVDNTSNATERAATRTLTNARINKRVVSAASYTTDTGTSLDVSACDEFVITAQAGALKFNNPSGTPVEGQELLIRVKDNATARALTYDTQFRASSDLALPTTTIISKTLYMKFVFNATNTKWDLLAYLNNF